MEGVVRTQGLVKTYKGGVEAVKNVSFSVERGEIFGFLGPNGAGKTTTIKMLTTLTHPTGGKAKVAGFDVVSEPHKVRENIGVVFQEPALDSRLTGRENLDFHARLYGIPRSKREKRIDKVIDLVGLVKSQNRLVKKYSGGMKRRLELARGLMHKPKVLFLDEPTLGLDVQTRQKIWDYILRIKEEENMTVFLTTHYMDEAEKVCNRVAIIDRGSLLRVGTPTSLMRDVSRGGVVEVKTNKIIGEIKGVSTRKTRGDAVELHVEDRKDVPLVVKQLLEGYHLDELNIRRPSLEEVFVQLTGRSLKNGETKEHRTPGRFKK